jgi:nucleotide-binding universal stress UspA family protein
LPELTVLIPLDGTSLSEQALQALPLLRSAGVTRVRLVSVGEVAWEDPGGRASEPLRETIEKSRAGLEAYLKGQSEGVAAIGLETTFVVRVGRAAEEILDEAEAVGADLICIATHGRSGIERFRLGSVADRVVRGAHCPTLVIGPNVRVRLEPYQVRRILVPLDGSDIGEAALAVADLFARKAGAGLDLVRVVSTPAMAMEPAGAYSIDLLESMQEAAELYLERVAKGLRATPIRTASFMGTIAEELLRYLETNPAELVVMGSHGRGGVARWLLGSVADRLLHGPSPVLVIRPGAESRLLNDARAP